MLWHYSADICQKTTQKGVFLKMLRMDTKKINLQCQLAVEVTVHSHSKQVNATGNYLLQINYAKLRLETTKDNITTSMWSEIITREKIKHIKCDLHADKFNIEYVYTPV